MLPAPRSTRTPAGIVVGIGGQGLETSAAAVRLGAEEAALRELPLHLVHGSRPGDREGSDGPAGMEHRQQRGRRLVNGAARDLAATPLGGGLQIVAESSPRTGLDLLLAYARTAVMLVLQREDGWDRPPGPTTRGVVAAAACPTLVTRSGQRPAGGVGVLVLLAEDHDPAPALALASIEASLRNVGVTVVDGGVDAAAVGDLSADAALMVVVRPDGGDTYMLGAVEQARCPVLVVAPTRVGA